MEEGLTWVEFFHTHTHTCSSISFFLNWLFSKIYWCYLVLNRPLLDFRISLFYSLVNQRPSTFSLPLCALTSLLEEKQILKMGDFDKCFVIHIVAHLSMYIKYNSYHTFSLISCILYPFMQSRCVKEIWEEKYQR